MSDEESTGHLVMIPEAIRPITPPSCLSTPSHKERMRTFGKDENEEMLESSQTESQRMEEIEKKNEENEEENGDDEMSESQEMEQKKRDEEMTENATEPTTAISLVNVKGHDKKVNSITLKKTTFFTCAISRTNHFLRLQYPSN